MLLVASCQKSKDEPVDPEPSWIRGTANWTENGEVLPFQARSLALRLDKNIENGTFPLTLTVRNQYGITLQSLGFIDIPLAVGKYPLAKDFTPYDGVTGAAFGYMEADLILKAYFVIEQDSTNFISVDSYNPETGEISGKFSVTMSHFQASTPAYPDTLYIRDGWYEATMNYR